MHKLAPTMESRPVAMVWTDHDEHEHVRRICCMYRHPPVSSSHDDPAPTSHAHMTCLMAVRNSTGVTSVAVMCYILQQHLRHESCVWALACQSCSLSTSTTHQQQQARDKLQKTACNLTNHTLLRQPLSAPEHTAKCCTDLWRHRGLISFYAGFQATPRPLWVAPTDVHPSGGVSPLPADRA